MRAKGRLGSVRPKTFKLDANVSVILAVSDGEKVRIA